MVVVVAVAVWVKARADSEDRGKTTEAMEEEGGLYTVGLAY